MTIFIYIILTHLALNAFIYYYFNFFKNKINIYDYPDNKKKFHKIAIPLMGGWIFMFNLIIFFTLNYSSMSRIEINILLCSLFFLLVGIFDDKYNLSPYAKFFFLISGLIVFFIFSENMVIKNVSIFNYNIHLSIYMGIFFSILCVLLFANALNLFDGINLQSSLYGLYFLLFLFFKDLFVKIILVSIISLIFIAFLNYKNKVFMGDSGTLFLGSFLSLLVIANYTEQNTIKTEEIFLLMLIPGVDMFRLFLQRMFNRTNPFMGDREHLHHYLLKLYGYNFTIISILLISILPSILNLYLDSKFVIFFCITFYLLLLIFLKNRQMN